jgi:chemotaxis protein MotB
MMNPSRAVVACLVAVASLTLGGCGCDRELAYKDVQIQELERTNKELEEQLARKATGFVEKTYKDAPVGKPKEKTEQDAVGPDVIRKERDREIIFSIESSILFKPGQATLSAEAKESIARVIALIKQKYPNHYVRVEGHTDDQKISRSKDKWEDNWDLAGGRARVVLKYLLDRGLNAQDLGFAGYAEQRPVSPGSSEASRKQNRRVEIVVIPK